MESRQFDLIILVLSIVYLVVQSGACASSLPLPSQSSKAGDLASSGGCAVSSIMLYSLLEHRLYLLMSTSSVRQRNRTCLFSLIAVLGLESTLASVLQVVDLSKGAVHTGNKDLETMLLITETAVSTRYAVRFLTALLVNVILFWGEWRLPRVALLGTVKMGVTSLRLVAPTATSL
ncbi:hypothetical protein BJ741DRAFT_669029 [Chytriomyces cf. hyalinus JEL632]|nr:hypothetical protein BJ741DRAFT_669029 [Chytriomyces cf. hyalinus JEL632]